MKRIRRRKVKNNMSLYDYEVAKEISIHDYPLNALIMAAVYKADDHNMSLLRRSFPGVVNEFHLRYHAPGGYLPGEAPDDMFAQGDAK
jgi:hypothetical protein